MSEKISTRCKGCVFATYDKASKDIDVFDLSTQLVDSDGEKNQCGCSLGRDEKLKVSQRDEDGSFILERFCSAFRPDEWVESLSFEDQLNIEQVVMDELYPRMGYFVKFNGDLSKLDATLESIQRAAHKTRGLPPFVVVINSKVEYNEEIWFLLVTRFGDADKSTNYHILQVNDELKSPDHVIDEAFIHAENGWVYITSAGELVPEHTVDQLHKLLSIDMKQIVAVEPRDGNGFIFPCFLFKFLNGNNVKIFRDESFDGRKFLDKLKERQGEVKTIYTWEEFDAS